MVARTGATVGYAKYVSRPPAPAVFASYLVRFRVCPDVDARYVGHIVQSAAYKQFVAAHAGGAAQPNANARTLGTFPIRIPPRRTQQRISSLLSAFDELIEINERRIELLEDLARSLYREWFVRFRFPGHEGVELVDSPFGSIPAGWTFRAASRVAAFLNGYAFKPSDLNSTGPPIIKIKQLKQGVDATTPRYSGAELPAKYVVAPGNLLFSWSADLGVYLWPNETGLLNQHLFKVTPGSGMTVEFLFHSLCQALPHFQARAQGTTMKHIKRSALDEVSLLCPGTDLVDRFSSVVGPFHLERLSLSQTADRLAATRDLLLPRLVSGRLDISDIDLGDLLPAEAA